MADVIPRDAGWVHVRFEGRSWDLPFTDLDIGALSSDDQVRAAVAAYLGVEPRKLAAYVVEHQANGSLTVRPEAVFG